jgi:PAS domain S-box-containing protein
LSATEDRAGSRIIRYAVCLATLLAAGALWSSARHALWPLAAVSALVTMATGPAVRGHPRRRTWRAAALLLTLDAAIVISLAWFGNGQVPALGGWSALYDVVAYLTTGVAALLIVAGRVRRSTWLGEVDFLVLFTALTALIWTLLVLLLAHDAADSASWTTMLVAYVFFDALVLAVLCRETRRGLAPWHRGTRQERRLAPARVWLPTAGAQLTLTATIGALVVHQHGKSLPEGWTPLMRLLWLAGVAVLGGSALLNRDPGAARNAGPLRRPTPATAALLLVALLGPPLEIARPGLADVVVLCLVAVVCLLLWDARRRVRAAEVIRSTAVALAGASDTGLILSSTLAAAEAVTGGRHRGIVVCANGPDGPCVAATATADAAAGADAHEPRPAARVERALAGRAHLTAVAPGQNVQAAQVAVGVAGEERDVVGGLGSLELLAAQAGQALDRVKLTAERTQRAHEARFRTLVRNALDVIIIVSPDGTIRFASPSARELLGAADCLDVPVEDVFGPVNGRMVRLRLARAQDAAEDPLPEYWTFEPAAGRRLELEVRFADLRTDPTVGGLVLTIRDVTEEHRLKRQLEHLAFHDALTGLANGPRFAALVEAELAGDERVAPCRSVALIAEICDQWDLINLRGQHTADRVLAALAERLDRLVDGASRLGGSILGALAVPADLGCADAEALAELLQRELSRPVDLGPESVTAQVGVGAVPVAGLDGSDAAISRAGLALAEAKTDQRRPWRVYAPSMLDAARDRAALREDLAAALAGDGLALHYQPIVDLTTGAVAGFEALARWRHPQQGPIPPSRFVPLAEETGLIVPLGRRALHRAAVDLARLWALAGPARRPTMAVNVSALQLAEPDFPAQVAAVIEETGVPPWALCLEITESSVLDRRGRMLEVLRELKTLGVRLSIDDFGTGHSALSYLPDLPFDSLKIDRSFVTTIATSPSRAEVVRGIVHIAGAIGMRVVAEGIETERQQRLLTDAACDYGQGFLYSAPVPFERAVVLATGTRAPGVLLA